MHCNSCKILISEALEEAGATDIHVKMEEKAQIGMVDVSSELSKEKIKQIIEEQGSYKVV